MRLDRVCPLDHAIEAPVLVVIDVLSLGRRVLGLCAGPETLGVSGQGGGVQSQAFCAGCFLPLQSLQEGFVPDKLPDALVLRGTWGGGPRQDKGCD